MKFGTGLAPLAPLASGPLRGAPKGGNPLFLPRCTGEGLGDVIFFLSNNASTIKNIAGAKSAGIDTVGKVATTTTDIIKRLRELKTQGMTNEAIEREIAAGSARGVNASQRPAGSEGSGGQEINSVGPEINSRG